MLFFYPEGGSWQTSTSVMYATTSPKSDEVTKTMAMLMAYDSSQFMKGEAAVKISDDEPMKTGDNKPAFVRRFIYSQYEAIGYIDEERIVVMLVLSCRTEEDFKAAYPAFKELVRSYFFVTANVKIDGK